jgi:hypothetical protein
MNIVEHYHMSSTPETAAMDCLSMLKEQGARAYDKDADQCVYYDPKTGNMCAVGVLLPDAKLARNIYSSVGMLAEDLAAEHGDSDELLDLIKAIEQYRRTLGALQSFHDTRRNVGYACLKDMVPEDFLTEVKIILFGEDGEDYEY